MNITSYNVTDVAYHYIALRVLASVPSAPREEQFEMVSRNVLKYASDKALRLMLPEPRGKFETVGEKVCSELRHFGFALAGHGQGYQLTEFGQAVVALLNAKKFVDLRRIMIERHLSVFDNLRAVVRHYVQVGPIFLPVVEAEKTDDKEYLRRLLAPSFEKAAEVVAAEMAAGLKEMTPKRAADTLRERILTHHLPDIRLSVPLFNSISDRLVSLRLVNTMKESIDGCNFDKSYTPCVDKAPPHRWYKKLNISGPTGEAFPIFVSEPDMTDADVQRQFLSALDAAFSALRNEGGYYDLPDLRDYTCAHLMIPEAAFDEGVNILFDQHPSPVTLGLQYEGISGRRKPLIRNRDSVQIYNLIRRA